MKSALTALLLCMAAPLGAQRPPLPVDSAHGRIAFSVAEGFADAAGRTKILLSASTEKPYHCLLPLTARMVRAGDAVVLDRWSISPVVVCAEMVGSAFGTITLPWDVGTHRLVIRHLGAEDQYRVTVTSDAVRVAPEDVRGGVSILQDTLVWRIPRNSFAVRCGTTELNAWVCAELYRMLARTPGIEPIDIPLTGRDPYGDRSAGYGHWHNERTRYYRTVGPRDMPRLQAALQQFYDAYVGRRLGYSITIDDWTGQQWFTTAARDGDIR